LQPGKIVAGKVAFYDRTAGMFSRQGGEARGPFETGWPKTTSHKPQQVSAGPAADIEDCRLRS